MLLTSSQCCTLLGSEIGFRKLQESWAESIPVLPGAKGFSLLNYKDEEPEAQKLVTQGSLQESKPPLSKFPIPKLKALPSAQSEVRTDTNLEQAQLRMQPDGGAMRFSWYFLEYQRKIPGP